MDTHNLILFFGQIAWIHKEEIIYKFPSTEYPDWVVVASGLEPFSKFFNNVLKWQRCEKKSVLQLLNLPNCWSCTYIRVARFGPKVGQIGL